MDNRYGALAASMIALLLVAACGATEPAATATPVPTDTPVPEDLSMDVPRKSAPVLDGTLSPDEWAGAHEADLTGGGTLLFMHDGVHLYLGLRGQVDSVGSICVTRGNELAVLHSSMGVGTAEYKQTEEGWQRARSFVWTWWDATDESLAQQQQAEFLQEESWLATTIGTGSPGEMEYQIALPEGSMRMAVIYFAGIDEKTVWWPAQLRDACRNTSLIEGRAGGMLGFHPEQWVAITPVAND
jgi:hypothetical protein